MKGTIGDESEDTYLDAKWDFDILDLDLQVEPWFEQRQLSSLSSSDKIEE